MKAEANTSLGSIMTRAARTCGVVVMIVCASCAKKPAATTQPTSRPASAVDRQDAAMKDPFNYSPWKTSEKSNISGGGTGDLDRRGLKRDVDHLLDP